MKKVVFLVAVLYSAFGFAAESTPFSKIQDIATDWGVNSTFFTLENKTIVNGCTRARLFVPLSNRMHDQILSIALSAFMAGKEVSFRITECTDKGTMVGSAVFVR
ncbi:hypothetical protein [Marinibactrum halimedae]|uniref:Uncharacterized protein n=1 Tax=Marinibactrum halimedae TaxID=1444977 RepID=A0AA37T7M9_9GAMM|nr:hypothetical protein [Marinibactrum halimedae]MCD9457821.1 hypothetical protein [Marinibactrum halimedae]GLS24805.1 hypothetical protein GCM10007877_05190 [Marinibactrum halimedae]